jgi:hypothetical protein
MLSGAETGKSKNFNRDETRPADLSEKPSTEWWNQTKTELKSAREHTQKGTAHMRCKNRFFNSKSNTIHTTTEVTALPPSFD